MSENKIIFPRACRLLRDIDEAGFKQLCECLEVRELHLHNKQMFLHEDGPMDKIGIVVMGGVRLSRQRLDGGRNVLEDIAPVDVFGATYAFRDVNTVGISASAVGDTTVLLFNTKKITHPCHKVCDAHMQFVRNLLSVMSSKTFAMKQKLRILSQRTIRARIHLLLQIYARRTQSTKFDIPFDRQALADYLCVDRCALSAELSKMQDEGLLEFEKNHFKLLKIT